MEKEEKKVKKTTKKVVKEEKAVKPKKVVKEENNVKPKKNKVEKTVKVEKIVKEEIEIKTQPNEVIIDKKPMKNTLKVVGLVLLGILFLGFVFWSSTQYEPKEVINYVQKVSYDEYINLYNSETPTVGLIARDGCYYCQQYSPIVKRVANKYQIYFNYIDTDTLTEEQSDKVFGDANATGTPTTVILMGGKLVDSMEGYVQEADLVEFLTNNGVI